MLERCEKKLPLQYNEPSKSFAVSNPWQRVGMGIMDIPKLEDKYNLQVIAMEYLSRGAEKSQLE